MTRICTIALTFLLLAALPASAQQPPLDQAVRQAAEANIRARLAECVIQDANASAEIEVLRRRLAEQTRRADDERRRADEAEGKLKAASKPAEAK